MGWKVEEDTYAWRDWLGREVVRFMPVAETVSRGETLFRYFDKLAFTDAVAAHVRTNGVFRRGQIPYESGVAFNVSNVLKYADVRQTFSPTEFIVDSLAPLVEVIERERGRAQAMSFFFYLVKGYLPYVPGIHTPEFMKEQIVDKLVKFKPKKNIPAEENPALALLSAWIDVCCEYAGMSEGGMEVKESKERSEEEKEMFNSLRAHFGESYTDSDFDSFVSHLRAKYPDKPLQESVDLEAAEIKKQLGIEDEPKRERGKRRKK